MSVAFCVFTVIGIFLGDSAIKNRVEKYIQASGRVQQEKEIMGGRLLLRRHHNRGAMLNLGEKKRPLVVAVSVVLTLALTVVFLLSLGQKGNNLLQTGLSLLLGGSFSNTYDRLKRKYVVDYVSCNVSWKPLRRVVFNLSDFCIIIGALLTVLGAS